MEITKKQQFMAIILGILFALVLLGIMLTCGVFAFEKTTLDLQSTYYDQEILPFIRTNLETVSGGDFKYDIIMDKPSRTVTKFGQHLDKEGNIVLFGKSAEFFNTAGDESYKDLDLLNKMIRKLYINSSPEEILEIDRKSLKENYYHEKVFKDYSVTSLYIDGLDTLYDHNLPSIANELRFSVLGFVKIYLGLINLNEVSLVNTTDTANPYYSFTMTLPTGEAYNFKYILTQDSDEITDIMVERQ